MKSIAFCAVVGAAMLLTGCDKKAADQAGVTEEPTAVASGAQQQQADAQKQAEQAAAEEQQRAADVAERAAADRAADQEALAIQIGIAKCIGVNNAVLEQAYSASDKDILTSQLNNLRAKQSFKSKEYETLIQTAGFNEYERVFQFLKNEANNNDAQQYYLIFRGELFKANDCYIAYQQQ